MYRKFYANKKVINFTISFFTTVWIMPYIAKYDIFHNLFVQFIVHIGIYKILNILALWIYKTLHKYINVIVDNKK